VLFLTAYGAAAQQGGTTPPTAPQPYVRTGPKAGETVTSRRRPQYDPVGVRAGSFFIYPSLELTPLFDTNIFQTSGNRKSDILAIISPEIVARSNWRRHEFNFGGRADIGRYKSFTSENYEDISFVASGRYDIRRDSYLFATGRWAQRHEERGSPDDRGGVNPTVFWAAEALGGVNYKFSRIAVRLQGLYRNLNFFDVRALGSPGEINNDDRDRNEAIGTLRVSYDVSPRFAAFMEGSGNVVRYIHRPDDDGFNRNNAGFGINAGASYEITGKLFAEAFAGYLHQNFDDSRFPTITGPAGGLTLTWNATGLTTVKAGVTRSIEQTTLIGTSGFFSTQFRASVDHELRRNVILSGFGSFQIDNYRGGGREDKWYRAGASAKWLVNRYSNILGAYQYTHRQSNVGNGSFTRHLLLLTIKGQL
jgi:hypothetical protein